MRSTPQGVCRHYDPFLSTPPYQPVNTGLDFDVANYMTNGTSQMRPVPDGIGTCPMGVGLSPDGQTVYVANFLARTNPPCVQRADCVPDMLGQPVAPTGHDPLPAALLDGKILFDTAARDSSVTNGVGLSQASPLFDRGYCTGSQTTLCDTDADCGTNGPCVFVPGALVSTSHDA